MARQMPKAGFYVFNDERFSEIIAVTGTTKGNKYMRPEFKEDGWANLLWTCVPAQKTLDESYTYHETEPRGWWTNNDLDYIVAGIDGGKTVEVPPPNPPKKRTGSDDVKDELAKLTGVPKTRWSRWTKVKVGSPADVKHDPKKLGGFNLAKGFPQHVGKIARIFGGSNDTGAIYMAAFEEADGSQTIENVTDFINAFTSGLMIARINEDTQ